MCDDLAMIMAIVWKVKEVEKVLGREFGRSDMEMIYLAWHDQKPFEIHGKVFDPPTMVRGMKAHQEEMGLRVHEVDPW